MSIERYFKDKEFLPSLIPNYNLRETQLEAAKAIYSSIEKFENALIEAPTGSGKSMAYLISSIHSNRKVLISTKTKQLMSQLLHKDIPSIASLIPDGYTIAELKGRKNYLCHHRFYKYIMPNVAYYLDAIEWFDSVESEAVVLIPGSKFNKEVIDLMSADRYQCLYSKCSFYDVCSFYRAKDIANNADMIITNHHMLLSDIALKATEGVAGIFDFRDHIIFDEAHSLPDIYAQYAGAELLLFSLILFFRDNKTLMSIDTLMKIEELYFEIVKKVESKNLDRFLYEVIEDEVKSFMAVCDAVVRDADDEEFLDTFLRYYSQMEIINSGEEGLRHVDRIGHRLVVKFTPFSVSDKFSGSLNKLAVSSVFLSATLSVGGNFDYFMKETGISKDCNQLILKSAFDYKKQGRLFVSKDLTARLKDELYVKLCSKSSGSVLIIANSIDRMRYLSELLKKEVKNKRVISQDEVTLSKLDLDSDVILVGVAIVREGIDLSRGDFRSVVIDKLPFEYFRDLYLSSKVEVLERDGGNGFRDFFLPRAVLYFKQSIGRLIRHESDSGVWLVLDERILTSSYGKYFLSVVEGVDRLDDMDKVLEFIN